MVEIVLGGKVRALKFGNYALMTYNALTNTEALEVKELNEEYQYIDFVRDIIFCALKASYKIKGQVSDFTINDVTEWVDEMDLSNIEVVVNAWKEAIQSSDFIKKNLDALVDNSGEKKN